MLQQRSCRTSSVYQRILLARSEGSLVASTVVTVIAYGRVRSATSAPTCPFFGTMAVLSQAIHIFRGMRLPEASLSARLDLVFYFYATRLSARNATELRWSRSTECQGTQGFCETFTYIRYADV
jgi:hypothetical protein